MLGGVTRHATNSHHTFVHTADSFRRDYWISLVAAYFALTCDSLQNPECSLVDFYSPRATLCLGFHKFEAPVLLALGTHSDSVARWSDSRHSIPASLQATVGF